MGVKFVGGGGGFGAVSIVDADKFDTLHFAINARVIAAEFSGADDGDANFCGWNRCSSSFFVGSQGSGFWFHRRYFRRFYFRERDGRESLDGDVRGIGELD